MSVREVQELLPITIMAETCVVFRGEAARVVVAAHWQVSAGRQPSQSMRILPQLYAASSLLLV